MWTTCEANIKICYSFIVNTSNLEKRIDCLPGEQENKSIFRLYLKFIACKTYRCMKFLCNMIWNFSQLILDFSLSYFIREIFKYLLKLMKYPYCFKLFSLKFFLNHIEFLIKVLNVILQILINYCILNRKLCFKLFLKRDFGNNWIFND